MTLLTARALFWLLASAAALRAVSGQRVARHWMQAGAPVRGDIARARTVAYATHRAARLLRPAPSCLSRALAAGRMLAAEGLEARLTIGIAAGDAGAGFEAHAWLSHDGEVLAGAGAAREYVPLCAIEASPDPAFVLLT